MEITALEWAPSVRSTTENETFIFTTPDGQLQHYKIENNTVSALKIGSDVALGIVSGLAWKGKYIITGDSVGNLNYFNFAKNKLQTFSTDRGVVRRIQFEPSNSESYKVGLVTFDL